MAYTKTNWEDLPSTDTPIDATNLQNIEDGIEEAHNLINELDNKKPIRACNRCIANTSYRNENYISFTQEVYNNSDGKIIFNSDGTVTINHDGYMLVSYNVWCHTSSTSTRPWIIFGEYPRSNATDYIDSIDDSSSNYVNLSASNCIIPVTEGKMFGLRFNGMASSDTVKVNDSSDGQRSYMTIELI